MERASAHATSAAARTTVSTKTMSQRCVSLTSSVTIDSGSESRTAATTPKFWMTGAAT